MNFQNILVVCMGNICRSPMAEALFKQAYPDRKVTSAGIEGVVGHPADPSAVKCMQMLNIDISAHVAQQLDSEMLVQADIVFAMTTQQVKSIEDRWTFSKGKVFRLCHWSDKNISDPYRKGISEFMLAKEMVEEGVRDWGLRL